MRVRTYTIDGVAVSAAGIAAAAAPNAGVAMTLTASPVALSPPREVEITSAGNVSAVTFVVTGLDRWGNTITESIVGPNTTTVRGRKVFASVSSVVPSATSATTASVGWGVRVPSPWVISNSVRSTDAFPSMEIACTINAGAADGQIETTYDNVMSISGEGALIDDVIAVTPPDTNQAIGAFARVVNTSGAGTTLKARFLRPGF